MTYAEAAESTLGESCPALFEAAHPEVYRRNAFRVTGLSVEATPREISQHTERLRMMRKYNANACMKIPLALDPPPDEHAMREAVHKLHDPEKRLIDEFFWFWPRELGQGKTDQALVLLNGGDVNRAAKHWRKMEQSSDAYVSVHNLAVLFHCLALDLEQVALRRKLYQKELEILQEYWSQAFKRWKVVLDHEPFWSRLTARIRALEDPRLTTGLARRIRASLPLALLSINAALAFRHSEAGNFEGTKRQLQIMRWWEVSDDRDRLQGAEFGPLAQKALREACEPLRQRIKFICKNAEEQVHKDPTHGDEATRELIAHAKPLLAIFDALLPPGDATRDAAHDEIAACALRCQVAYGNKTENWKVSLELLEMAFPIAVGQALRDRIQENINTVKRNLEYATCWFCKQNPADDKAALEVEMFGDVHLIPTWQGTKITWRHGTVRVPRCAKCKSAHVREEACATVGGLLGFVLGIGASILIAKIVRDRDLRVVGCLAAPFGLVGIGNVIGAAIGAALRPKGVKPESAMREFPRVKQLLSQGWNFGKRPST
jgi:hypothetical protein